MTLPDGDAMFGGLTMGASNDLPVLWDRLRGLTDLPPLRSNGQPPDRIIDQAVPAWADIGWRTIEAINCHTKGNGAASAVEAMRDRVSIRPFTFHDSTRSAADLMVACVADTCEYDQGPENFANRSYRPSMRWLAYDSTIWSAATTPHVFGSASALQTLTVNNAGTWGSPSGRGWTASIVAHGTVRDVFIRIPDTPMNVVLSGLVLPSGSTIVIDEQRRVWIGSMRLDSYARTGTSWFPDWPILAPGANTIEIGCLTGTVTGQLDSRSSW